MNGFRKSLSLAAATLLFAGGVAYGQNPPQDNHQQDGRPASGYHPGDNNGRSANIPANNGNRGGGAYAQPGQNGQGNYVRPGDNGGRPNGNLQGGNYNRPGDNRPGGNGPGGNTYNRPGNGGQGNAYGHPGNYGQGGNGFGQGGNGYVRHDDWQRGHRMAPNDWGRAQRIDYRRYHLNAPPRGYEWRQVDGNYVLAAVTTGIIASVVAASLAR